MATKKSELVLTCNATAMKDVIEFLDKQLDKLIKKRDQLNAKGVQNWTAQDKKNFKQWGDDIAALTSKQQKNREEMVRYGEVMKDLAGAKTKDLKRALGEVKRALDNMSARDPGRAQLEKDLKKIQNQVDANTVSVKKNTSAWGALGTTIKNLVAYAGVFAMFNRLKSLFGDFVTLNRELSDQLANIRKVSGLAMQDIYKLEVNLAKIDTRSSIQQLNELAYAGAKLGFGNYGTEGLESFVKSAVKVQNALSEDMGEESMTALSKLVEVMGLIPKMGVERAMDAAGSAIFKLASTSTATGTNIIEFTKRLMGLANVSHVTTSELLALGSASDSMGLMAEVSSTAFTKMFTSIQSNYAGIEKAVGLAQGTLKNLLDQGRTMDALVEVFDKMHGMSMEEMKARGIFKELGSEGSRMNNVMTTMANKIDMLRQHLLTSNEAFEDATAVAKEYEIQMDTAQAYAERASNAFAKAFVNPEGVDVVKDFSKAWYEVAKSLTANETFMFSIQISLKGILLLLKGIMTILPELLAMVLSGSAWAWIARLREGEGLLTSLTAWFGKLTVAQKAFFKAAGAVGLALTVYEVGKAFYNMATNLKKANEYMKDFNATLSDVNKEQYTAVRRLDGYVKAINEATVGTNQRKAAINNFNKVFKPYLSAMLTEKSTADDIANAYKEVVKQMKAKIALQAKEKDIEKFVNPRLRWEADKLEAYDESIGGTGNEQYNGAWLKGFVDDARAAGKSISDIATELNDKIFHLDKDAYANVYGQRDRANVRRYAGSITMNTSAGAYTVDNYKTLGAQTAESQLQKAIQYAMQSYSTSNAMNRINKKYKPWEKEINKLMATEEVIEPYNPSNTGDDKDKKAKKDLQDRYEQAKKDVEGLIAKIDELYNLQEAAARDAEAMGELSKEQADDLVKMMEIARNEALMRARKAIGTGNEEDIAEWKKWAKEQMPKLMADSEKWSTELYEAIINADITTLREFLATLNGDNIAEIDARPFLDKVLKKGAENKKKSAVIAAQFKERTDKFLQQYDAVRVAQTKMQKDLEGIGIMTETGEEMAKRLAEGRKKQPKTLANGKTITDEEAFAQMGAKFMGQGTIPYRINIENADEALQWIRDFGTDAQGELENFAQAFPKVEEMIVLQQRQKELLEEQNRLKEQGRDLTEKEKEEFGQIVQKLAEAVPTIKAMFYQLETSSNQIAETIEKQVEQMMGRKPIGLDEMQDYHEREMKAYGADWQKYIDAANATNAPKNEEGDTDAAVELKRQRDQQLIDLEHQYQQELWQIREQYGLNVYEQYQKELEALNYMHDKGLISEKKYQTERAKLMLKYGAQFAQNFNQRYVQQMSSMIDTLKDYEITSTEDKYDRMIAAAQANGQDTTKIEEEKEAAILEIKKKYAAAELAMKIAEIGINTAAGIMQAWVNPGFPGAIPLTVMIGALGAAQTALAIAEYNKAMGQSVSGSKNTASTSTNTKTKLASGMLTYEKGNVKRFVGQDGKVYTATEEPTPKDGLVTHPIATTVQGQPALVAENGPEIVVGRETTKAIMMNEPELIRYLANYQQHGGSQGYSTARGLAAYDSGNISEYSEKSEYSDPAAAEREALRQRLDRSDELMAQVLYYLQNPIPPEIAMYDNGGKKGLHSKIKEANSFMARYGG